jgi:cytochrome bd-type quinol oxidase subunit 2
VASEARATRSGPGRVLIAVYAIFALSATARAAVQIATKFTQAPLAYLLSALAGVVYIVATVALAKGMRRLAWATVGFELVGVLTVGTLTVLVARDFPDDTVWSGYGRGYGFVPLLLPFVGLLWLWHTRPR